MWQVATGFGEQISKLYYLKNSNYFSSIPILLSSLHLPIFSPLGERNLILVNFYYFYHPLYRIISKYNGECTVVGKEYVNSQVISPVVIH